MKHIVLTMMACLGFLLAKTQWYNPERVATKAQIVYSAALEALHEGEWEDARNFIDKAIEIEPRYVDAWLSKGGLYGQLKKYDSAVYCYEHAYSLDSVYSNDLMLPYSIDLAGLGRFADAKVVAEKLISNPETEKRTLEAAKYRLKSYNLALALAEKHGTLENFSPFNLGDSINSIYSEYYPSFTIDDSIMVFTRRMKGFREDFIKATKKDSFYHKANPVDGSINEEPKKGGISISLDGQWLIFAADFMGKGFGNFDLYNSYATEDGWSEPLNLGDSINTDFWESSPSISPDKQSLYFASNRPGGFGGKDLYVSQRWPNGKWGMAKNMGPDFNTSADDLAPFIHADNQTLYFTSGGLPGYGGSDIFLSRKGPGGRWSIPENLGYPINTIDDDGTLIVTADGKKAYYSANRPDSRGALDLYSFDLPIYARPKRTLWIKGQVMDAVTKKGIPSAVQLKDIASNQILEQLTTDETGSYLVTLPVGHDYSFTVNRKGYFYYSNDFLLASQPSDSTYTKDILLQPIALNTSINLKNILFETNSFELLSSSNSELDRVVQLLADNPTVKVQINGHTDNSGVAANNNLLSKNRAKAVVVYMISKKIAPERLSYKGFGSSMPIAPNTTEEGKAKNRRTEMIVVGM